MTTRERRAARIAAVAAIGISAIAGQAAAQSAASSDEQIQEVVVTANKRGEQSLQRVATSIGVLTGEALAKRDVVQFVDVTRNIAGLNIINQGPGQNTIMIRGLVGAGESTVGLYYDNLPTTGSGESAAASAGRQTDLVVFDADRIEVLRGPQSTLYGSSALAGVVRILTNQADPTGFKGRLQLEGASVAHGSGSYSVKGMVNLPFNEKAALRVVAYHVRDGGFVDNPRLKLDDYNSVEQTGLRLNGKVLLGENTTLTGQLFVQKLESGGGAFVRPYNGVVGVTNYPAAGWYQNDAKTRSSFDDNTVLGGVTLDHSFDFANLTITQSFQRRKNTSIDDTSSLRDFFGFLGSIGAFPNVPLLQTAVFSGGEKTKMESTEARLATKLPGRINGVVGLLRQTRTVTIDNQFIDADPATGLVNYGSQRWYRRTADMHLSQIAAYGELTFQVTDQISVLGGVRVFQNKRHDIARSIVPFMRLGTPGAPDDVRSKESKAIYKVEADYKPNETTLLYASASQGYRAGGTVVRVVPELPPAYGPDYTWNYEVGAKTQWLDRRLQVNVAAYRVNWYNTQIAGEFFNGAFEGVLNCKGLCARSQGVEADIVARPMPGLDLTLSGTVFKAKWLKDQPDMNGSPKAGSQFTDTPTFTFSTSAGYTWALSQGYEMAVRADVQHSGRVAFSDYRPAYNLYPPKAYTLVNTSATLSQGDRWALKLFARNLFDAKAVQNVNADSVTPYSVLINQPRTIGVQLDLKY